MPAVLKSMGESQRNTLKSNISMSNCLWWRNYLDMSGFSVYLDASPIDFNAAGTKARFVDVATLPSLLGSLVIPALPIEFTSWWLHVFLNHFSQLRESCTKITPPWTENSKEELIDLVYILRFPVLHTEQHPYLWVICTFTLMLHCWQHPKKEQREVIHPIALAV